MKFCEYRSFSMALLLMIAGAAFSVTFSDSALADTFGTGDNTFEIEFVAIGDPGNAPDTSDPDPVGSVSYDYRIGKFEISEQMIDKANTLGDLGITKDSRGPDKPATSVSWFEAAKFVNWLNESSGHSPAYKFIDVPRNRPNATIETFALWEPGDTGYNSKNLFRNTEAKYVLPSSDEWYKAAYYDPDTKVWNQFPIGVGDPTAVASGTDPGTAVFMQDLSTGPADIMQAGGLSPLGTMAQGGNAYEWLETEADLINDNTFARRARWGGSWVSVEAAIFVGGQPANGRSSTGFRIVSVPEPCTFGLLCISLTANYVRRRRSRKI
jgi:hypothetical protein